MSSLVSHLSSHISQTPYVTAAITVALLALTLPLILSAMGLSGSKYDVKGKHCYVTGGSSGLGHALAIELVKRGAHVTIVARGQARLDAVKAEIKALANPSQIIQAVSADLTSAESATAALHEAAKLHGGRAPDHLHLCAGFSQPQFFIDASAEQLKANLDGTYWVAAYTAHAAAKMMVSQRIKGKIVFVASFLGYTSFAGYSPYAPGKYALRGLADSLRSEMILHEIDVHIFMPCGIQSEGYVNEQKLKPRITKKIEEDDVILAPEAVAASLLKGLQKGQYQITNLLITDLVRLQARGAAPGNNILLDTIYWFIGGIGVPIWRMITDRQVKAERGPVRKELEDRGFYERASS